MPEIETLIRQVLTGPKLAGLATVTGEGKPWVRYVMIFPNPEDFTLRIAAGAGSRKVAQIRENPEVHLNCGVDSLESAGDYLQIAARAEVTQDDELRRAHWYDGLEKYFKGPDDPSYALILVRPYRIECMTITSMEPRVWEA
jgi:general stress protein 26